MFSRNKIKKLLLTDIEWQVVKDLAELPVRKNSAPADCRQVLSACLFRLENNLTWKEASEFFSLSPNVTKRYYEKLKKQKRWTKIINFLVTYRSKKQRVKNLIKLNAQRAVGLILIILVASIPVSPVLAQDDTENLETEKQEVVSTEDLETKIVDAVDTNEAMKDAISQELPESNKSKSQNEAKVGKEIQDEHGEKNTENDSAAKPESDTAEDQLLAAEETAGTNDVQVKQPTTEETNQAADDQKKTEKDQQPVKTAIKAEADDSDPKPDESNSQADAGNQIETANSSAKKEAQTDEANKSTAKTQTSGVKQTPESDEQDLASSNKAKTKTVFVVKELKATTSTQAANVEEDLDEEIQDTGDAAQINNSNKPKVNSQETGLPTTTKSILDDKMAQAVDESTYRTDAAKASVIEKNSETPEQVDAKELKEQLKKEVLAEIRQGCLEFEDGSFYCIAGRDQDNSQEEETQGNWLNFLKLSDDGDGSEEIYYDKDGRKIQLTDKDTEDLFPVQDISGRFVVWQSLVNGRWQIFYYIDGMSKARQLTSGSDNNMNPQVNGETIVWQGWVGNDWDIFYAQNENGSWQINQLTDNELPDMFPKIANDLITWQGFRDGHWQVFIYDMNSGRTEQLSYGTGNFENPRFQIVWDDRQVDGEVEAVGFDLATGKFENLTNQDSQPQQPQSGSEQPLEEKAIMLSRTEGSQNNTNKNKTDDSES